jgi:hypothetical protein
LQLAAAQVAARTNGHRAHAWRRLNDGLWDDPKTALATIATVVGITSGLASLVVIPFA